MQTVRYADLVFQPDLLVACRDDGTQIHLTRQERALLLRLCRQPRKLVTREQLLQSMSDLDGEFGERNIDYLMNRLRKRLGDDARAPRFIATQYGEGYVWIADPVTDEPVSAFLLIGPVYGLQQASERSDALLDHLAKHIARALGGEQPVRCLPAWRPGSSAAVNVAYRLEVSLLEDEQQVHLAMVLRDGRSAQSLAPFRVTLLSANDQAQEIFAASLAQAIWSHAALPARAAAEPTDLPLHLKLHDAGMLFAGDSAGWRENAARLEAAYASNPADPVYAVLLAINRYSQLVAGGGPQDWTQWPAIEDEIERLALGALPLAQGNAPLQFGIAKVLFFLARGSQQQVGQLVEEAFQNSTAFASAFAMKGQWLAAQGEIERALGFYDRAIELAERGSQFHIYLLIMKITALLADNRRSALEHLTTELYALDPALRVQVSLFFLSPRARQLPPALVPLLEVMSRLDAQRLLMYLYRISARQFQLKRHQRNVLRGAAVHLADRFGADVLPAELARLYPGLAIRKGG